MMSSVLRRPGLPLPAVRQGCAYSGDGTGGRGISGRAEGGGNDGGDAG